MMSRFILSRSALTRAAGLASLAALMACNGSGGGSSGGGSNGMILQNIRYGRRVVEAGQESVVSPLSTVQLDPLTGESIPGTLAALDPSVDLNTLVSFGLGANYLPRVVPRNAVLLLQFDRPVDPATVFTDDLDPATGVVTRRGSIQLRFQKQVGQPSVGVPIEVKVMGAQIMINPVFGGALGFPASPVDFGPSGEPRADATGFLRLTFDAKRQVMGLDGTPVGNRPDKLGDPSNPIGFNPGNSVLDFIAVDNLVPTNETFNGFLPDLSSPRIIRPHTYQGTFDVGAGDSAGAAALTDLAASFSTLARQGLGEWAGGQLTLRPGQNDEEIHTVTTNTAQTLNLVASFQKAPKDGDAFELLRAEFFEPDPGDPIDPALFDSDNPENSTNTKLLNFIAAYEIDSTGNRVGAELDLKQTLPAFSELVVRFNESISQTSLGAWESFRVRENPYLGIGNPEKIARITTTANQDEVSIQPVRESPGGAFQVVGWGPGIQSLSFELVTVPSNSYLQNAMDGASLQTFLDQGVRGVKDLGGQPLGFSNSQFDPTDPAIVYSEAFFTDESLSSFNPPPVSEDWGAIIHRFQGRPVTGIDPQTGLPGVAFQDYSDMYLPIADVNLAVNGFLAGQPVVYITKIHDDFFPPPDGQFGAFPLGLSAPLSSFFTSSMLPPWEHNGARFQHVYRDVDASPGRSSLAGTLLDLIRVSFAPIGGNVTTDVYDDVSVHAAHAYVRPKTNQNGAGATDPYFALNESFDYSSYWAVVVAKKSTCPSAFSYQCPNVYDKDWVTTVPAGTTWTVSQANLFSPPFDGNAFHPWPDFTTPFQYNNGGFPAKFQAQQKLVNKSNPKWQWTTKRNLPPDGDSLLLEYRVRPQTTPISRQNGFTFSPAILITLNPFFRVWSLGERGNAVNPDDVSEDVRARCASPAGGAPKGQYGDNSRYFAVFDYVKTTSVIQSPFVRAEGSASPDYYPAVVEPPLSQAPPGTIINLLFAGTNRNDGQAGTTFSPSTDRADTYKRIAFKVTLVGNTASLITPNFDLVMIPFKR